MNILEHPDKFVNRHIGPNENEISEMLKVLGVDSLDTLINEIIPEDIKLPGKLKLDEALTEYRFLEKLKKISKKNKVFKSFIGI